ncbi:hypothetical protein CEQ90_05065 [Lewinellaceae bacterium SD302]|nr:hypothetical protein CEQ90_05065 [Lewinellaceae bacterium SD302]
MRLLSIPLLLIFITNISAQKDNFFRFEYASRLTILRQQFIETDEAPDIVPESFGESGSSFYGSAHYIGTRYNINDQLSLGLGFELQLLGMRSKEFPLDFSADPNGEESTFRFIDRFYGYGLPLSVNYNLSSRLYLRAVAAPTYVIYRETKVRTNPKDALPGLQRTSIDPTLREELRNINLSAQFGVGYRWLVRHNFRLFVELGGEYYTLNLINDAPLNRRIYGSSLKLGIEL